jgi:hypothetical protein
MMVFHLVATAGGGPLVEFLLQFVISLGRVKVDFAVHIPMLHWKLDALNQSPEASEIEQWQSRRQIPNRNRTMRFTVPTAPAK